MTVKEFINKIEKLQKEENEIGSNVNVYDLEISIDTGACIVGVLKTQVNSYYTTSNKIEKIKVLEIVSDY